MKQHGKIASLTENDSEHRQQGNHEDHDHASEQKDTSPHVAPWVVPTPSESA